MRPPALQQDRIHDARRTALVVDVALGLDPQPEQSPVYLRPYGASNGHDFASSTDISRIHRDSDNTTTSIIAQHQPQSLSKQRADLAEERRELDTKEAEHCPREHNHNCISTTFRRFMAAVQQHTHVRRTPLSSSLGRQTSILRPETTTRQQHDVSDSDSDDEPPPAIKFSKVTEALLNDRYLPSSPIRHNSSQPHRPIRSTTTPIATLSTPNRQPGIKILRRSSPSAFGSSDPARGSTPPRIVHVGSSQKGSARRTISISGPYPHRTGPVRTTALRSERDQDIVTPGPAARVVPSSRPRAGSNASQDGQRAGHHSSSRPSSRNGFKDTSDPVDAKHLATSLGRTNASHRGADALARFAPLAIGKSRSTSTDQALPPGSTRVKRAPIATGTFLKSGPMRRGFRRRESEEEVSPTDDDHVPALSHPSSTGTPHGTTSSRSGAESLATRATSVEPIAVQDFAQDKIGGAADSRPSSRQGFVPSMTSRARLDARPQSRQTNLDSARDRQPSVERAPLPHSSAQEPDHRSTLPPTQQANAIQRTGSINRSYRYVSSTTHDEASEDQENAPPPTFRRNKEQELKHLRRDVLAVTAEDDKPVKPSMFEQTPVSLQKPVERKALNAISNNTPHRPAPPPPPPPPKMSVLETATATAGASTTRSRKKRTHTVINGKLFTQMGRIGKGGSSEVFLVMAENYKTFAMKKVRLDNCDESAVIGFKGEIDLLKKLTDVDRVIRLYDWELNEDKQELLVLMEKGDTDLYRIMTLKNGGHDGKFDPTFTRYYWKEMLECVQAVHEHDIVHSDLKPANFLVVQGRLKLIDFGIANAIEVDHTCNVHRESHVGTPNYMSPESIIDTSSATGTGRDAQGRPLRKDMKIGKSSDVWSLGCVLYQMTYGRPPFAHIPTIPRIMAITNPKHIIEFPDTGIGGVSIPPSLKGVLKRCLQREAELRPTIPQLLNENNDFLYPESNGAVMIRQDVLEQIINKVVERCRDTKRGMPLQSEVNQYAPSFMTKIKEMAEKI